MTQRSLKRRVAILIDAIEDEYQAGLVRGIASAGAYAHTQLLCIAGGVLDDTQSDERSQRNFIYELVDQARFDGIIALSGALGTRIGVERLAAWSERYRGTPLVNLGVKTVGSHSIEVDGAPGMREVVEHLIVAHNRRRIAFIAGPRNSHEAQERYRAYQSALEAHGIELDEKLVLQGNWLRESGAAAVHELFDVRGKNAEAVSAIACADDCMALGALDALRERGIAVPGDVAVTGFDDIESNREAVPPLTTVRQPLEALGREGFRKLSALMNGEDEPLYTKMVAHIVQRRSCGCASSSALPGPRRNKASGRSFESTLMERRALLCAELARSAHGTLFGAGNGWEERLVAALTRDLVQRETTSFVGALERFIGNLQRAGGDLSACQSVLGVLRTGIVDCAAGDVDVLAAANDIFDAARVVASESLVRTEILRKSELSRQLQESFRLASVLLRAPDIFVLRHELEERLRALGIPTMAVGLFTEPGRVTEHCLCVAAYCGGGSVEVERTFRSSDFGPPDILEKANGTLLVQPLVFDGKPIGIATTVLGSFDVTLYDQLRETLATGLQGYRLSTQQRAQD